MLDCSTELQRRFENSTSSDHRKMRGQVFTPPEVARFMAGLFSPPSGQYNLLDPGAGIGVLTAAFCERLLEVGSPIHLNAHVYENDPEVMPLLRQNLDHCRRELSRAGHKLDYTIYAGDFIAENCGGLDRQRTLLGDGLPVRFDGVIMNPPYFKLRKDSPHAKQMAHIVHGQPNVYAFFMALAARLLKEQGEVVAITPRSFCNGLYFRGFRRWYFDRVALDRIHVFESRTDTFKHSGVLQESIISKVHRLGAPSKTVTITTSFGRSMEVPPRCMELPLESVVDSSGGDCVIRIPEGVCDREVMQAVESLPVRFSNTGLKISTGPVVLFRATEFLRYAPCSEASVPLLLPHNVKPFETRWPVLKKGKPIAFQHCSQSLRLLVPVKNYVLLKRFSAKEEKRRLTAGCFQQSQGQTSHIGIENHLNYIYHAERDLSDDEMFGVAAFFNSALIDRYFRTISGNTQVNATEIRAMPFPDLKTAARIGKQVKQKPAQAEAVVFSELGISKSLAGLLAKEPNAKS